MAPVPLRFVIVFSSQDPNYPVENILSAGLTPKSWLCAKGNKSGTLDGVFQLDRECVINSIDIGNHGSLNVELSVGRSSWPQDQPFPTLMSVTSLMPPRDAKRWENINCVHMFKQDVFNKDVAKLSWDRLKVKLSQPLRRDKQFGLTILRVHSREDLLSPSSIRNIESSEDVTLGAEKLKNRYLRMTGQSDLDSTSENLVSRSEKIFKASLTPQSKYPTSPSPQTPGTPSTPSTPLSPDDSNRSFYLELDSFLRDLNIDEITESGEVSIGDLRRKMETILCRKLTKVEKKIFRQRTPDFIQGVLDRKERKAKRRKAAEKLEFTMETDLPKIMSPTRRENEKKWQMGDLDLDFKRIFEDSNQNERLKSVLIDSRKVDGDVLKSNKSGVTSLTEFYTPVKIAKTNSEIPKSKERNHIVINSVKKTKSSCTTMSRGSDLDPEVYFTREGDKKKPEVNYSASGGFTADNFMENYRIPLELNTSLNRSPVPVSTQVTAPSPSRGVKRKKNSMLHHMPPVVEYMGETRARHVVPPVKGRRIKAGTVPDSCRPAEQKAMPGRGHVLGDENDGPSSTCPLCNDRYPLSVIEEHAASCDGLPDIQYCNTDVIINDVTSASNIITTSVEAVNCPICADIFGIEDIEAHAAQCVAFGGSTAPICL